MLFKQVPGGYVFRAPNPWIFGRADHYLVSQPQQDEIVAILTPRRPILAVILWVAGLTGILLAIVAGLVVFAPSNSAASVLVLMVPTLLVLFLVVHLSQRRQLRRLQPILAGASPTDQRITNAEMRRALSGAMSFKRSWFSAAAFGFACVCFAFSFVVGRNHKVSLLADHQLYLFVFNTVLFAYLATVGFLATLRKIEPTGSTPPGKRILVLASALALLGLAVAVGGVGVAREMSSLNQGVRYEAKGEIDNAIASFTKAIESDEKNVAAYVARARIYLAKGDHDRAVADYSKIIEIEPDNATAYRNRGASHRLKARHDQAIADYTKAIELEPSYALAYYFRSFSLAAKGDNAGAIADLTKSLELKPNDAHAYFSRGLRLEARGDNDGAIADYSRAIEIDARHAYAYFFRGRRLEAKGDHDRAIADFTKAIAIDPKDTSAYNSRAAAYNLKGERDSAIADYRSVIALLAASPVERQRQDIARGQLAKLMKPQPAPSASPQGSPTTVPN